MESSFIAKPSYRRVTLEELNRLEIELCKCTNAGYVLFAPVNERVEHAAQFPAFFGQSVDVTNRAPLIGDAHEHACLLQSFQPIRQQISRYFFGRINQFTKGGATAQ